MNIVWSIGAKKKAISGFLKMKICAIFGNLLGMIFFELLSGRDSKTVNLFAWFLAMVCSSKRYSSLINQEKPRIRNLVKNNLIYGCIFFLLARGAVGVLFFDLLEKHILVSDGRYWFQILGKQLETDAQKI